MRFLPLILLTSAACAAPLIEEAHATDITYGSAHIVIKARTYLNITVTSGTDTITIAGHAFVNGDKVRIFCTGSGSCNPGGVSSGYDGGTSYFVRNVSGNDFQLSTTAAGAILNITSAGSSVHAVFDVATLRVAYDVDPARLTSGPIASSNDRADDGRTEWYDQTINRLPAATKIYVRVYATDANASTNTSWGCSAGVITEGSLTGLACEGGSDWPFFTTEADPGPLNVSWPDGKYPKVATGGTLTYPTFGALVEGDNLFTVAADCSDFESQKALAVAANASKHVKFVVQSTDDGGSECDPGDWPAKSGTYKMVITSSSDEKFLPPAGTRVQDRHKPYLAPLTGRLETLVGGNGYIFSNIYLRLSDIIPAGDVTPIAITSSQRQTAGVGSATNYWRFDLASPHGLNAGGFGQLHNVANIANTCSPGGAEAAIVHDSDSFSVICITSSGTAVAVPVGPDVTAGRYFVPSRAQRAVNITPSSPSCAGGDALVEVDSGSVVAVMTGSIIAVQEITRGSSGLTNINDSWKTTLVSDTSFCLDSSSSVTGTYVPDSVIYASDTQIRSIAEFNATNEDNWMDRSILEGRGFPDRTYTGMVLHSNNSGIVNSRIQNISAWMAIDPVVGTPKVYGTSTLNTTSLAVDFTYGQHNTISNNYVQGHGILLFAQQGNGTASDNHVEDVVVSHNYVYMDPRYMAGGSEHWDGLYYASRQGEELKRGMTILLEHNYFEGNWVDWVAAGWNLTNTIRGSTGRQACTDEGNVIQDFIIRNNFMTSTSGGIYVTNYDDSNCLYKDTKRIAVENNVITDLNWWPRVSVPSVIYGASAYTTAYTTSGAATSLSAAVGIFFRNNIIHNPLGGGPRNMSFGRVTDLIVENNLFTNNEMDSGGFYTSTGSNGLPTVTTNNKMNGARWINTYGEIGLSGWQNPPRSTFKGNAVVRGTENQFAYNFLVPSCFTSTATNCNVSAAEMSTMYSTSNAYFDSPAVNTTWSGTTPNARFAEMGYIKVPDSSTGDITNDYRFKFTTTPSQLFSNSGISTDRREVGVNWNKWYKTSLAAWNVRVHVTGSTTATVAYSSRGACTIQYSASGFGAGTVVAGSTSMATIPKTIALTGLSANTFYDYWLNCPQEEFTGRFKTNP